MVDEPSPLVDRFITDHAQEAAGIIAASNPGEAAAFVAGSSRGADLLERMSAPDGAAILSCVPDAALAGLVTGMDPGRAAGTLAQLEPADREKMLTSLDASTAAELRELLAYPPESAGSLMQARFPRFRSDMGVGDALGHLRRSGEEVQRLVVVSDNDRLEGVVPVSRLVMAQPEATLGELVSGPPVNVLNMASREEVLEVLETHKVAILPVVDIDSRVVGIIDQASLMRAAREEAASDLQSLVGVSRDERALSPPAFAVRRRLPWLNINLLTAFLAASVVGLFESTIAQFTALAVLMPVVAGQSGNTGAQALAVVMRGLALREIRGRHASRVLLKEGITGLVNGVSIALVTCAGVYLWSRSPGLCVVIGTSMIISMLLASLAGAGIPLLLNAFRQDPAQSGSIILTTITDITGFFSFLGLATLLSRLL
ncbi:MAG: magnesium transporter [Arenicellales bacterium]